MVVSPYRRILVAHQQPRVLEGTELSVHYQNVDVVHVNVIWLKVNADWMLYCPISHILCHIQLQCMKRRGLPWLVEKEHTQYISLCFSREERGAGEWGQTHGVHLRVNPAWNRTTEQYTLNFTLHEKWWHLAEWVWSIQRAVFSLCLPQWTACSWFSKAVET